MPGGYCHHATQTEGLRFKRPYFLTDSILPEEKAPTFVIQEKKKRLKITAEGKYLHIVKLEAVAHGMKNEMKPSLGHFFHLFLL